jgi:hypothetical protein
MPLKVTVYGDKIDLADELRDEFHAEAKDAVSEGAGVLLDEVQRLLSLQRGTSRTAAAEGQPPEQDTADLYRSFRKIPPRVRGNVASSGIKSNHPGGNRLEWGFTDARGIRTLSHPFLRPAIANTDARIGELLRERLS